MAPIPVDAALDIAREELRVRQQLMREHDRLRRLQMREARGKRVDVLRRLRTSASCRSSTWPATRARLGAQVKLQIVRRLVVARAAGAQLAAERTEPLGQHAFDERVHVLVVLAIGSRLPASNSPVIVVELSDDRGASLADRMPARSSSLACACDDTMSYGARRKYA